MRVRTKRESAANFTAGRYGPRLRQWNTLADLYASGYRGKVGIRSWRPSWRTRFHVDQSDLAAILTGLVMGLEDLEQFYFGEMAPDEHIALQGEFADGASPGGAFFHRHLTYSVARAPMKPALAEETRYASGSAAEAILRHAMSPASHDDFTELRAIYPDSMIEFSCYNITLGDIPGRNTLFWEIRTDF